jgi:diketogulonate reductase-like aldo/keto reductase
MAQETASMNDGRAIPQLGLVVDAYTTTQDVEAALDAGVAHIRAWAYSSLSRAEHLGSRAL